MKALAVLALNLATKKTNSQTINNDPNGRFKIKTATITSKS